MLHANSVQKYVWVAAGILVLIFGVTLTILVTESLHPGFIDPEKGNFRYISDGFADHRASPFICLVFIFLIVALLLFFSWQAIHHQPGKTHRHWLLTQWWIVAIYVSGFLTVLGFALLAANKDGPIHFLGAGIFICMHLVLQMVFLHIVLYLFSENKQSFKNWAIAEWTIVGVGAVAAIVFVVLMMVADLQHLQEDEGKQSQLLTISAAAEYFVFAAFVALNILAAVVILYISNNFVCDEASDTWQWKSKITNSLGNQKSPIHSGAVLAQNRYAYAQIGTTTVRTCAKNR